MQSQVSKPLQMILRIKKAFVSRISFAGPNHHVARLIINALVNSKVIEQQASIFKRVHVSVSKIAVSIIRYTVIEIASRALKPNPPHKIQNNHNKFRNSTQFKIKIQKCSNLTFVFATLMRGGASLQICGIKHTHTHTHAIVHYLH